MFTLPTLRQENRIKRLDLSALSFRTVSPRDLMSPTKTPSEKAFNSKSAVPFERSQTTATPPLNNSASLTITNRSQSMDAGSLALPVKYEPSKFKPIAQVDDSVVDDESRYALHTSGIEKSIIKPKNNSISIQGAHTKEVVSPQMFGIRGSEIKKKSANRKRKLIAHSLSIKNPEMKFDSPKADKQIIRFDMPKKPSNTPNSPQSFRETGMSSRHVNKLLGLHTKIFSARNTASIKKLLTEEDYMEIEDNSNQKGYINQQEYSEMENDQTSKMFQKVSTDLQCFIETKTAYKESLVKPPQYSLYQTFTKNRNTKHFRMTSVDAIKEFCKGVPVRLSKAH